MTAGGGDWAEQIRRAFDSDLTPRRQAARRMGESMRALIEQLTSTMAPADALDEAADRIDAVRRRLADYPGGRLPDGFGESANAGDVHAFFDNSPMLGTANPLAPPLEMDPGGDVVVARVCFGSAYEGPPGCVHGGYIAAAFDEVLGLVQSLTGHPGMTGTLAVRYRRPTPLHVDLVFEGRVERVEGRKIYTSGVARHGDEVTAESEAVFVRVDFHRIAELYDTRRTASDER